jgi:hypothetical protein
MALSEVSGEGAAAQAPAAQPKTITTAEIHFFIQNNLARRIPGPFPECAIGRNRPFNQPGVKIFGAPARRLNPPHLGAQQSYTPVILL